MNKQVHFFETWLVMIIVASFKHFFLLIYSTKNWNIAQNFTIWWPNLTLYESATRELQSQFYSNDVKWSNIHIYISYIYEDDILVYHIYIIYLYAYWLCNRNMYKLQIRCSRCVFPKSAKSYNRCRRSVRQTYKLSEKVNKFRKDCHKIYHSNSLLRQIKTH